MARNKGKTVKASGKKALPEWNHGGLTGSYRLTSMKAFGDESNGTYQGIWTNFFYQSDVWGPYSGPFDFNGRVAGNNNYGLGTTLDRAYLSLTHGIYDETPDPNVNYYEVEVTLHALNDLHAHGSRTTHKWYLDHSTMVKETESSDVVMVEAQESPSRDSPIQGDSGADRTVDYHYPKMVCHPTALVGTICKGFEKDTTRPGSFLSEYFAVTAKDWAEFWFDVMRTLVTKDPRPLIGEICTILIKSILSDEDDPMVPSMITISGGACRYIVEHALNREIRFSRKVLGFTNTTWRITGAPAEWGDRPYVHALDTTDSRYYEMDYSIKVTPVMK